MDPARGAGPDWPVAAPALGGLVRPGSEPDPVEFRHALIRQAVDAMLVPPERTDLARSLLAALPTVDGQPADPMLEVAADLARQAGCRDLAAGYYLRAGQDAVHRGTAHAGTVLLEQAVSLAEGTVLTVTADRVGGGARPDRARRPSPAGGRRGGRPQQQPVPGRRRPRPTPRLRGNPAARRGCSGPPQRLALGCSHDLSGGSLVLAAGTRTARTGN
jgi:hypothetical protein